MPTDLPANLGDMLPASLASAPVLQQVLAATAAAQTPGTFVIKKSENIAKRAGVKSSGNNFIFSMPASAISNPSSACFTFNINVLGASTGIDPKWVFANEAKIAVTSDTVGIIDPKAPCLLLQGKPNINWKPGSKATSITVTISKPYLAALRAAATGDITFSAVINGYVEPSSSEDDK